MEGKVIKPFFDLANPDDTYDVGDTFTGTEERVRGLAQRGFVEIAEKPKTARKRTAKAKEE